VIRFNAASGDEEAPSIGQVAVMGQGSPSPRPAEGAPAQLWVPPVVAGLQASEERPAAEKPRAADQPQAAPAAQLRPLAEPSPVDEDTEKIFRPRRRRRRGVLVLLLLVGLGAGAAYHLGVKRSGLFKDILRTALRETPAAAEPPPAEAMGASQPVRAEPGLEPVPPVDDERKEVRERRGNGRTHARGAAPRPLARQAPAAASPSYRASESGSASAVSRPATARPAPPSRAGAPAAAPARPPEAGAAPPPDGGKSPDHYEIASGYLREKKVQLAVEELKRGLARNPRDAKSYRLLGMAYSLLGSEKSAVEAFERFVQLDPGHKDATKIRAIIADYYKRHPK
jgi:hypothetical protein